MVAVDPAISLSRCAALAELPAERLRLVAARCTRRQFAAGETLIRQGAPGDSLMILLDGKVTAVLETGGARHALAEIRPFEILGEMALVTGEPRTTDVVADTDGEALVLSNADFHELVQLHPDLGVVLTHIVAGRLGTQPTDGLRGKVVDRYRIERWLGRGAMAIVYAATDVETEAALALKMMSHELIYERGALARFQREAEILRSLEHENIVRVLRQFTAFRTSFIAMEYCDGGDLAAWIGKHPRPAERQVRAILGQMAAGLRYLHGHGIVHRDLKPHNVLATGTGTLKLADFGLARAANLAPEKSLTATGALPGTPLYMAPELLDGGVASAASDVYAFGCVAMELLIGEPLFGARTFGEVAAKKRAFAMPSRRAIGRGITCRLHRRLRTCLAVRPEERTVDLEELAGWSAPLA